jgi:ribosomal protein S14
MAARTTREQARARIRAAFEKALDQVIPADASVPLRGRTFREWEDQADGFDQAVTSTLLEERAALEDTAQVELGELGRCPHCGSPQLYLQQVHPKNKSIRTGHGEVVLGRQSVRCRACGRSFSPSGA